MSTSLIDPDGGVRQLWLQRWKDSADPPPTFLVAAMSAPSLFTEDGVRIARNGSVGWDWGTPDQADGVFYRFQITNARPIQT